MAKNRLVTSLAAVCTTGALLLSAAPAASAHAEVEVRPSSYYLDTAHAQEFIALPPAQQQAIIADLTAQAIAEASKNPQVAHLTDFRENKNFKLISKGVEFLTCLTQLTIDQCLTAGNLANTAISEARKNFDKQSLQSGQGDAFRHCYWSALMTTNISERAATIVGTNHEQFAVINLGAADPVGQFQADRTMDLNNNAQGRWAAVAAEYNIDGARNLCLDWARNGVLITLD